VAPHKDALERDSNKNQRRVIYALLTRFDPNPDAMPCNSGQYRGHKTPYLCGICKPVQRSATSDRALVMSSGRFESARWLSSLPIDKRNTQDRESPGLLLGAFTPTRTPTRRGCLSGPLVPRYPVRHTPVGVAEGAAKVAARNLGKSKLIHTLLPRNASRSAQETVVL
jgi:hypothetical protein